MQKVLKFGLLFFVLTACEPMASFEKPQPENARNLTRFPERLRGTYLNPEDSTRLFISQDMIIMQKAAVLKFHKSELEKNGVLKGNIMGNENTGGNWKIRMAGDTLIRQYQIRDTLFQISPSGVLRKFRGQYFLNTEYAGNKWQVKSLLFKQGNLVLREIASKEDLEKLRAITQTQADTMVLFNPSRQQFKQFVKQGGFSKEKVFIRLK